MSRTIDERIVQMTFENQEFESRAKQTATTLGKLGELLQFKSATDGFAGVERAASRLDLSGITQATYKISDGFNALEEIAVGVFRRIGDAIGNYILGGLNKVKSTIDSLSFDQIGAGFTKYNDLTASVQTLVNSTGKSIDEIDGYLERLMWYSDETSFGFTDMTKALGTMVSSGGEIDNLIPLLMGVGNATAYAGKGAAEFSRVIYNLNQSYSQGALNRQDWKSIELAGVDSKVLKEQLMDAAVALGTITKGQAKLANFNDLLTKKAFNREVMEKAFGSFAQMTLEAEKLVSEGKFDTAAEAIESLSGKYEEFAERAFKSAQEAKSFKEAIEATQDAVSSGWMQTFKLIFGNYEESKALWTDVTEALWEVFASGAKTRNDILKEWKNIWTDTAKQLEIFGHPLSNYDSLTQTQALVKDFLTLVTDLIDKVKTLTNETFDFPTIEQAAIKLFKFVERIREGLQGVIRDLNADPIDRSPLLKMLESVYTAALSTIKMLMTIAREINHSFIKPLINMLKPVLEDVFDIVAMIADVLDLKNWSIIKDMSPIQKILQGLLDILRPMVNVIGDIVGWIKELVSSWKSNMFGEEAKDISLFGKVLEVIANVISGIAGVIKGSINLFSKFGSIISNVFTKIGDAVKGFLESNGTNVTKLAEGGILAYIVSGIAILVGKLKKLDLKSILETITSFLKGEVSNASLATRIKDIFDAISGGVQTLIDSVKIKNLDQIANALVKLAAALFIISLIDSDKIGSSLATLGTALAEAMAGIYAMSKMSGSKGSMAVLSAALISIGIALIEIAAALKIISTIDDDGMIKSLGVMAGALLAVGAFIAIVGNLTKDTKIKGYSDTHKLKEIGSAVKAIGFGLIEIAAALWIVSKIGDWKQLGVALVGITVALAAIGAFIALVGKFTKDVTGVKIVAIGAAVTAIAFALIELAAAMWILSKIKSADMDTALKGLFLSLMSIAAFSAILSKTGAGKFAVISASMMVLSAALLVLTGVIAALSRIGWDNVLNGLGMLATIMGAIGLESAILGLASPFIFAFSLALAAFGAALLVAAKGLLAFTAASTLFSAAGVNISGSLLKLFTDMVATIVALIPSIILGIGKAILNVADEFIALIGQLIFMLIGAIETYIEPLIEAGFRILMALLTGIRDNIGQIVSVVIEILGNFIDALANELPGFINKLLNFIISAINGLADAIRNNAGELGAAIGNLASALITAIIVGLGEALKSFFGGILELGGNFINALASLFGASTDGMTGELEPGSSPLSDQIIDTMVDEDKAEEKGGKIPKAVVKGVLEEKDYLMDTVDEIGTEMTDKMDRSEDAKDAADNTANGFIGKILSRLGDFTSAGAAAGKAFMEGFASTGALDYASPSKATARAAGYVIEGFVNTIYDNVPKIMNTGEDIGSSFMDALSESMQISNDLLNEDLNPVISPVMDLSDVQRGSSMIADMLSDGSSYRAALAVNGTNALANSINQNGVGKTNNITLNASFNINGNTDMNDPDTIKSFARKLANEINVILGNEL